VRILAGRLQAVVQDLFAVGHFAVYRSLQIDARVLPIGWDRQTLICSAAHGLTWATSHVKADQLYGPRCPNGSVRAVRHTSSTNRRRPTTDSRCTRSRRSPRRSLCSRSPPFRIHGSLCNRHNLCSRRSRL
jgi:hypothetical protein